MMSGLFFAVTGVILWMVVGVLTWQKARVTWIRGYALIMCALSIAVLALSYVSSISWSPGLVFTVLGIIELRKLQRGQTTGDALGTIGWKGTVASLASFLYLIAAAIVPVLWVSRHVDPATRWPVAIALELLAFGVPVALALWWFVARPAARRAKIGPWARLARMLLLFALAMILLFAFAAVPSLCMGLIQGPNAARITWTWTVCAVAVLMGLWAWARYYWRPRYAPGMVSLRDWAIERGMLLDRVGEPGDNQT
jgi:hypothetical protein